jgi:hypothetical protein
LYDDKDFRQHDDPLVRETGKFLLIIILKASAFGRTGFDSWHQFVRTDSGAHAASYPISTAGCFLEGAKLPEYKADGTHLILLTRYRRCGA